MSAARPSSRRSLLKQATGLLAASSFAGPFEAFARRLQAGEVTRSAQDFGELKPVNDHNTGLPLLKLPEGFTYTTFGWEKDLMANGLPTPSWHDGMICLSQSGTQVTLCRNHEVEPAGTSFGAANITYDPKATGGCTNMIFDLATRKLVKVWPSIAGTVRNCAGGPTPWGTWVTCEESVVDQQSKTKQGMIAGFQKTHGWAFDVPATEAADPKPLEAMGRFVREAIAVDPTTGIVFQTEDRPAAGFYRFIPKTKAKLSDGGKLQMMKLAQLKDTRPLNTPNTTYDVSWVDIPDPTAGVITGDLRGFKADLGVFRQGAEQGAATFGGLEGCWHRDGFIYFTAKSGGPQNKGQIWEYHIAQERLRLVYVSQGVQDLNMPDNICASPRGGFLVCEDGSDGDPPMRLHCLTKDGRLSTFCRNNVDLTQHPVNGFKKDYKDSEWAGPTFSPDGTTLFVNIQTPGITFAITGPWKEGLL